jgi:cold shock CspA family protein
MTDNDVATSSTNSERLTGRVKWFNNKAGYGFITVTDGEHSNSDVFIHHSAINVSNQQYKYLVLGEYVDFNLVTIDNDKYKYHAGNVNGVKGGKLMCETRHELKVSQNNYRREKSSSVPERDTLPVRTPRASTRTQTDEPHKTPRGPPKVRSRGEGPREETKEWTLVANTNTKTQTQTAPRKRRVPATSTRE